LFKGLIIGLSAVVGVFGTVMKLVRTGILLFNLALYANPIGVVVVAVVGLIAVLGQVFVVWDKLVNAFKNMSWGKAILSFFDTVGAGIKNVMSFLGLDDLLTSADVDTSKVQSKIAAIDDMKIMQPTMAAVDNIPSFDSANYADNLLQKMPTLQGVNNPANDMFNIDSNTPNVSGANYDDNLLPKTPLLQGVNNPTNDMFNINSNTPSVSGVNYDDNLLPKTPLLQGVNNPTNDMFNINSNTPSISGVNYADNLLQKIPSLQEVNNPTNDMFNIDSNIQGLNIAPINIPGNSINKSNQKSTSYGDVHLNFENAISPEEMEAWTALKAG
jgi:hypothetical protein